MSPHLQTTCSTIFLNQHFTSSLIQPWRLLLLQTYSSSSSSSSSQTSLQESIKNAIQAKNYQKLPDLLTSSNHSYPNPNPFSFLSKLSSTQTANVVDEILPSFIPIRPRSKPHLTYSYLLSHILQSPNPLPLSLPIIQRMLRSGCLLVPQTRLLLSQAWIQRLQNTHSVETILSGMHSVGYSLDCGTCDYLILSLCKVDRLKEAAQVLRGMGRVGCFPVLDSYGALIGRMCERRMTSGIVEMVKEMLDLRVLNPRKETIVKAVDAMRANREISRGVEMIEFLESNGVHVGFEVYELALEGCLEVRQFVLAGKFVIRMTDKGFIPYIRVRQRVFEGLVSIGETGLASTVKQRFAELKS